jgi:glyoxylase-like metal-dependent hydrolase (beta-lactamase superfamily II)
LKNKINIYRNVNSVLESNTYIISNYDYQGVYIIDPGDINSIQKWFKIHKKIALGVFITHTHFDHIYGLNELMLTFPDIPIYIYSNMIEGLFCTKLNTSKYHGKPYVLDEIYTKNFHFLEPLNKNILWNKFDVITLSTPGHTTDSMTINMFNFVFTGDALIPGIKTTYRNKLINLDLTESSVLKIYSSFEYNFILYPGHGKEFEIEVSKQVEFFCPINVSNEFYLVF